MSEGSDDFAGICLAAWVSDEDMHDASKQNARRPFVSLQSWNRGLSKIKALFLV